MSISWRISSNVPLRASGAPPCANMTWNRRLTQLANLEQVEFMKDSFASRLLASTIALEFNTRVGWVLPIDKRDERNNTGSANVNKKSSRQEWIPGGEESNSSGSRVIRTVASDFSVNTFVVAETGLLSTRAE